MEDQEWSFTDEKPAVAAAPAASGWSFVDGKLNKKPLTDEEKRKAEVRLRRRTESLGGPPKVPVEEQSWGERFGEGVTRGLLPDPESGGPFAPLIHPLQTLKSIPETVGNVLTGHPETLGNLVGGAPYQVGLGMGLGKGIRGAASALPPELGVAAKGALKGGWKEATEPVPFARRFIHMNLPKSVATGIGGGILAEHYLGKWLGPFAEPAGAVVGAGYPFVKGAIRGAREALDEFKVPEPTTSVARNPLWSGPADTAYAPSGNVEGPMPQPRLPSGRTTGPAPVKEPFPPYPRNPLWKQERQRGVDLPEEYGPAPQPQLPSGRTPGSIANARNGPARPPAETLPPEITLDQVSQSLAGKKFSKLSPPEQETVVKIANRMQPDEAAMQQLPERLKPPNSDIGTPQPPSPQPQAPPVQAIGPEKLVQAVGKRYEPFKPQTSMGPELVGDVNLRAKTYLSAGATPEQIAGLDAGTLGMTPEVHAQVIRRMAALQKAHASSAEINRSMGAPSFDPLTNQPIRQ